jgi:hypothetical protein
LTIGERLIGKLRLSRDVGPRSNNFAAVPQNKPRNEEAKAPKGKASKPAPTAAQRREMQDEWTITRGPNWGTDPEVPPRTGNQARKMLAAMECGTIASSKRTSSSTLVGPMD